MTDPNQGVDIHDEVKFMIPSGDIFSGGWCRPQNDGAGLRAITLITYANLLNTNGGSDQVKQQLWTGDDNVNNGGAIVWNLDYVANGSYENNTCDLWEEIRSTDLFWNKYTMRTALRMGAV